MDGLRARLFGVRYEDYYEVFHAETKLFGLSREVIGGSTGSVGSSLAAVGELRRVIVVKCKGIKRIKRKTRKIK